MKVKSRLPRGWWLHPHFDFGNRFTCPYIWFAYWLITWGSVQVKGDYWQIRKWRIPKLHIGFMPD